jgi:carbon storage regulator
MLVLSRQRDQSIMIGDQIEIKVVDVRGEKVRLGINAPRNVKVDRKEIYDKIRRENESAANMQPGDVASIMDSPPTMRMGPQPPEADAEEKQQRDAQSDARRDEALKLILQLPEADCVALLGRIRQERPQVWKQLGGIG